MNTTNVYALQLENGKYYIGKARNVQDRFRKHLSGYGSKWTQMHKPLSIIEIHNNVSPFVEDAITKDFIAKYGIENVRGGSYSTIDLSQDDINIITREIRGATDCCFRCGRDNHWVDECYAKKDVHGHLIESDTEDESQCSIM